MFTFFRSPEPEEEPEEFPYIPPSIFQHTTFDEYMLLGLGIVCSIPAFMFFLSIILHVFGIIS